MSHTSERRERVEHRSCPQCRRDNQGSARLWPGHPWGLSACAQCGFVYLEIVPTADALFDERGWEVSFREETRRRRAAEPGLHQLSRAVHHVKRRVRPDKLGRLMATYLPCGDVLDIGCGTGYRVRNWPAACVPFGIELETRVIPEARARFEERGGAVVHAAALEGLRQFGERQFDGAVLFAYLEHEPEPAAVLKQLHARLKPRGVIVIKTPNYASVNRRVRGAKWCGFRFPDHVNYFTPRSMRTMLTNAGFDMLSFHLLHRLPTSDNMWAIAAAGQPR